MVRYLSLISFTQQGIGNVKNSPDRARQFRKAVEAAGGKVLSMYWSVGEVDGTLTFEAPDEQTATTLLLSLAQKGNVRTRTLRVYDEQEFTSIVAGA